MSQKFIYSAWGLTVESCLELLHLAPGQGAPDLVVRFGQVPAGLEEPELKTPLFQAAPGLFLFEMSGVGRFLASQGREIIIEPAQNAQLDTVRLILLGSVLGACLHQRGLLALHASALGHEGRAVLFTGVSSEGKSTLAAGLVQRGWSLLADDLCVITQEKEAALVLPGEGALLLWQDALKKMGREPQELARVRPELAKHFLPVARAARPLEAERLYILHSSNLEGFKVEAVRGTDKLNALLEATYQFGFIEPLGAAARHFGQCARLARLDIRRLTRFKGGFALDQLVDFLMDDLKK